MTQNGKMSERTIPEGVAATIAGEGNATAMAKRQRPVPFTQPDLVCGILDWLSKHGVREVHQRRFNTVIEAADLIYAEFNKPIVRAKIAMGLEAWLASDDTGLSSLFMAYKLADGPACEEAYPLDPDDFGRCYRFLQAVSWTDRKDISAMAENGKVWQAYAKHWDEMARLFEEESPSGRCPRLYELMQRLRKEAGES